MRQRKAWSIALLAAFSAIACCAERSNAQTIEVRQVNGKLTVNSGGLNIKSSSTTETVRWVGPRNLDLQVKFLYDNPCDPKSSHLDGNPAVCRILPGHSGAYGFQVGSQKGGVDPTPIILVRVGSCDVCDIITHKFVGIACDREQTSAAPPDASVSRGEQLSWFALGNRNQQWTVHFDGKSPCSGLDFNNGHPVCSVNGSSGTYHYKVTLNGCARAGEGTITVGGSSK